MPAPHETPSLRGEALLYAGTTLAICAVLHPVLLHPTELLFSPVSDLLPAHHPYRVLQLFSLEAWGRIALWNPTAFGGTPLVSDPQSGIYYPFSWLHLLAPGEGFAAHGWTLLLHLLIGANGTLWWLGRQGFGGPARVAAALVFALSGKWFFHVLWKGHLVFLPVVWLPWQLGLIDAVARRPSARQVALLGGAAALMIVGTHPQLLLYAALLAAAYAVFTAARAPRRMGALVALGSSGLLALALSAAFLLPVIDGMDDFARGAGFAYGEVVERSLRLDQLLGFLVEIPLPPEPQATVFVSALATALLCFAGFAARHRRHALFFGGATLFLLWYALGDGAFLYRFLVEHVPGFGLFRFPNRAILILGLPFAWLCAAGLTALCQSAATRAQRGIAAALCLLGVALAATLRTLDAFFAAAALAVPLLLLLARRAPRPEALAWTVVALLFLDLGSFAARFVRTRPAEVALGHNPVAERLSGPLGRGRVYAFDRRRSGDASSLPSTYATRAGIESLRGFNPLIPEKTLRYLLRGVGGGREIPAQATTVPTFPIASRPHLDLFNVRWIVSNHPVEVPGLALRERFDDLALYHFQNPRDHTRVARTYLYENTEALPRAWLAREARHVAGFDAALAAIGRFDPRRVVLLEERDAVKSYPGAFAEVTVEHRGDELRMRADAGVGGYLVVSEVHLPGWQAEVDGEPREILHANALFRALELGPGEHEVRMAYRPRAVGVGRAISLAAVCVAFLCLGRRRSVPYAGTPAPSRP